MKYKYFKCFSDKAFIKNDYELVPFRRIDLMKIRKWRNRQMEVLRQKKKISKSDQKNYFKAFIKPTFKQSNPIQLLFSFLLNRKCIGYGGLVHINWEDQRGEVSFLIDNERAINKEMYKQDFINFLDLLKIIAFKELRFNRIFTETFDIRDFHISILEEAGFKLEGRMKEHVFINGSFVDSLIHSYLKKDYIV